MAPSVTRIRLLGGFELHHAGVRVSLPARKSEGLLAVLGLRPGVAHARDWLAGLLWPSVPVSQARTSLRQALGHLRKACGDELVQASADRVHLEPRSVSVDAAEFEKIVTRPAIERVEAAELGAGELLAGFPPLEEEFDRWLSGERAQFTERAAGRLAECVAALSAAGELERALGVGERLLELDATREGTHRALMKIHLELGDAPAALRQYERCRDALKRSLELQPSVETEQLRQRVLAETSRGVHAPAPESRSRAALELAGRLAFAVLPFSAASDGESERAELFARALTEDVTTELARFRELALVSRATLATLAETTRDPERVAQATGARAVLSGSLLVTGERVRISAAVVDTTTGLECWAERWEVESREFLSALDRLARSVTSALALKLDESRLGIARRRAPERLEVYDCWLRGLECLRQGTPESDDEARRLFERALTLSPTFARAHAGLSLSHFNDWSCQAWDRWELRERLAFEAASRAVELDESDHVTHAILARIRVYRREFEQGERHVDRAVSLNPNDANMLMHAALAYAQLGKSRRAVELCETAFALNPQHPVWYYPSAAFVRFVDRRPEEAFELAAQAPDCLVDTRALLAACAVHCGRPELAEEHMAQFLAEFRRKITSGREPEPGEALRWLVHVNPLRRSEDSEYFLEGLRGAGLR